MVRIACIPAVAALLLGGQALAAGMKTGQQEIKGSIIQHKDVTVKDTGIENRVVLLKTSEGRLIPVDLGPSEQLKEISLHKGASLEAHGKVLRVGDRPVFFAQQLAVNGTSMTIQRQQALPSAKPSSSAGTRTGGFASVSDEIVSGKVLKLKSVRVQPPATEEGSEVQTQSHQVALLQTELGRDVVVDLGPKARLDRSLKIQRGQRISVSAKPVRIGDRLVLLADRVRSKGKTVSISQLKPMSAMRNTQDLEQNQGTTDQGTDQGSTDQGSMNNQGSTDQGSMNNQGSTDQGSMNKGPMKRPNSSGPPDQEGQGMPSNPSEPGE